MFFVPGLPQTKGSTKAFMRPGAKFPTVMNDNPKTKSWQGTVSLAAHNATGTSGFYFPAPLGGPVSVLLEFVLPLPKSVKRARPSVRPDLDKLVRAVLDGLTGVVFVDDAQVVEVHATKAYGDVPGVYVTVRVTS